MYFSLSIFLITLDDEEVKATIKVNSCQSFFDLNLLFYKENIYYLNIYNLNKCYIKLIYINIV